MIDLILLSMCVVVLLMLAQLSIRALDNRDWLVALVLALIATFNAAVVLRAVL